MKITSLSELAAQHGPPTEDVKLSKGHFVYLPADDGPFRCDHCEYYASANRCNNRVIFGYAERGERGLSAKQIVGDLVRVDPGACSDEFERKSS